MPLTSNESTHARQNAVATSLAGETSPDGMWAARIDRYGPAGSIGVVRVPVPVVGAGEVLVRVAAASVNPLDWHNVTGRPWIMRLQGGLRRPKQQVIGTDLAGRVVQVGEGVDDVVVGDDVFGAGTGTLAELAVAKRTHLRHRPSGVTADECAGVFVAGATALQAIRTHAKVQAGERVLVIGAGGGVGLFAVQIAAHDGAVVVGLCSAAKASAVSAAGAHQVLDYAVAQPDDHQDPYDVIVDMVGTHRRRQLRQLLRPGGRYVIVGGPEGGSLLGPLRHMIVRRMVGLGGGRRVLPMMARLDSASVATLEDLLGAGHLQVTIGARYPLTHVGSAMSAIADGHALGKLIVQP
jgi:NADPH:quinone reductase-like Zn-dependent oxidoreductase